MKQSASINAESPARIGGVEGHQPPQTAAQNQRSTVLNESGYVDFKQTLRRYKDQNQRESLNGHRKHQSLFDLQVAVPPTSIAVAERSPKRGGRNEENDAARKGRVDQETIEGKKTATVKDRARLRDLIKNI